MSFIDLVSQRYSLRQFSPQKVEAEKLDLILQAGRLAPTACNFQPQRFLLLESQEALNKLHKCTDYHFGAPVAILICYDPEISWKRSADGLDSGYIDAAIAATQMMLQATELGLGSTCVCAFDPAKMAREFSTEPALRPAILLPLGYPAPNARPAPAHTQRKAMETLLRRL